MIPEEFRPLLESRALALVSTLGPGGAPQTSPIWFLFDGGRLRFSLVEGRQKLRNLRRDPRVSVVVIDPSRPTHYIELRGTVELAPDPGLAVLDPLISIRRTNRRTFDATVPTDAELRSFTAAAVAEDAVLVPVLTGEQHRLVARLTQEADAQQRADPAYLAELARWTNRAPAAGDGIVAAAVPHVDGTATDDVPMRDFDTRGEGELPPSSGLGAERTMMVLGTLTDDDAARLRSGEAMQRVLLEITRAGWAVSPVTQAVEVPVNRLQLRTWSGPPFAFVSRS